MPTGTETMSPTRRKRGPSLAEVNALGKQTQAGAADAAAAPTKTVRKPKAANDAPATAKAGTGPGRGRQKQGDAPNGGGSAAMGKQGASASGKSGDGGSQVIEKPNAVVGGTKQVLITEAVMSGKPGRPQQPEEYPFGDLTPAKMVAGKIMGPSFFIPESEGGENRLAAARKRHKALFWSRTTTEQVNGKGPAVKGIRVWRGTPDLENASRR